MKTLYFITTLFLLTFGNLSAQNVSLNLLTQNSGLVSIGGTVFLQIDIGNTDAVVSVPSYKLRPQISVPASIVSIPATGHQLPTGWSITFNSGSVVRLSNGTDNVPPNETRTILLAIQGNNVGGPFTISGNLLFSNGNAPGSSSGTATPGDITADNTSTSTAQVISTTPITLSGFTASISDCKPLLKWTTDLETNSSRFQIERSNQNPLNWIVIGNVLANGNSSSQKHYSFMDEIVTNSDNKVLYRLKMIDRDGRFKYSYVLPVYTNCKTIDVNVFPNPVVNNILFVSLTGISENVESTLMSTSGQVVKKINLMNGTNSINVGGLAAGEYFLNVNFKTGAKKLKILIGNR